MKYQITAACGHTVTVDIYGSASERERKVAWYENNYICDECRDTENAKDCEEVEMSYAEYKTSYSECKTKKDSYDKKTKTIVVYVPAPEEPDSAEGLAVSEIVNAAAATSVLSTDDCKAAARKMFMDKRSAEELACWRTEISGREPAEIAQAMLKVLDICEKYWYPKS